MKIAWFYACRMHCNPLGLRYDAIKTLYGLAQKYAKGGFLSELVEAFFVKKIQLIMKDETKREIKKILESSISPYGEGKVMPEHSSYHVEKEELMIWSMVLVRIQLIPAGNDHYMELYHKLFPEKAEGLEKEAFKCISNRKI